MSSDGETLVEAALRVLNTSDPVEKARLGDQIANHWLQGLILNPYNPSQPDLIVPDRPARLTNVKLVSPSLMPKLGKAGSLQSRQAIVHSLVHTESWAIDLSWDIIARFGKQESMPKGFFDDFVRVAQDEGRHFTLLAPGLRNWVLSMEHSRLMMVCGTRLLLRQKTYLPVLQWSIARGMDVLPTTILRFRKGGDNETADLLETVVYPEEILIVLLE
ncbi:hypothetical protein OSB04_026725 [Centaurea solstitialis]|uniref:Uncharacterized protein n=1 Tax=Centaurea solstitialis TaxID=347529 RepID=A0AA38SDT2_9ASTR|nr:hypothetical protein OSB04_026725 [Centaurea solstitialis]